MPDPVIRTAGLTRDFGDIRAVDSLSIFGVVAGAQALPPEWKKRIAAAFSGSSLVGIELAGAAILLIVNAVLLSAAMARFKRARLILD